MFDVGDADVVVAGGGSGTAVDVQRRERSAFGHLADTHRTVGEGVFRVRSRCPAALPDTCSVRYRVVVPDNVPVEVLTDDGGVRFSRYRGSARVTTGSGDVDVDGFCGSVRAVVPEGRYRVDAQSASGRQELRGIASAPDAPFRIQALSSSGDVVVEAGS